MKNVFERLKRKKPWEEGIRGLFLALLSFIYAALVGVKLRLYILGLAKQRRAEGITVISVGNLTVGGTGKTPITVTLTRMLMDAGKKPAVVSRGYGRESTAEVQVVSNGRMILEEYPLAGDEAALCAHLLPGAPVICAPQRLDGIIAARDSYDADTAVLDDGFNHLAAARDLDIVLIDATNPFGNGWLFPAGPLREPLSSLERADGFIITRANLISQEHLGEIKGEMLKKSGARPIFTADITPTVLYRSDNKKTDPAELKGQAVCLLSGIGTPEQFEATVTDLGAKVERHAAYPDHHRYTKEELEKALADAGGRPLLTTEKDYARMPTGARLSLWRLGVEAKIREEEEFGRFIERVYA